MIIVLSEEALARKSPLGLCLNGKSIPYDAILININKDKIAINEKYQNYRF
jgi:hypothetical protein